MKIQNILNVWVSKSQKKKKHYRSYTGFLILHKNPTGVRFVIASKICFAKQISKYVSNVFKLLYSQIGNFHKNAKFLSSFNRFWVLQNSDPPFNH